MHMDRSGRGWTELGSTLEAGAAALAGFLAGLALDAEWPVFDTLIRLLFGH